jgi:cell division protein FtsW (lipid II flippase)
MISIDRFLLCVAIYLAVIGILNILMAIVQADKPRREKYGAVEGVIGLFILGFAIAMVLL